MRQHAINIILTKISGKNLGYENRKDLAMFQQISHVQYVNIFHESHSMSLINFEFHVCIYSVLI